MKMNVNHEVSEYNYLPPAYLAFGILLHVEAVGEVRMALRTVPRGAAL